MLAAHNGDINAIQLLLDHPCANVAAMTAAISEDGLSALMLATFNCHAGAVKFLLDHPNTNARAMMAATSDSKMDGAMDWNVLMIAAESGHVDVIQVLLDHSCADVAAMTAATDREGNSALMLAAINGHVGAMKLLLDHPRTDAVSMMATTVSYGWTALVFAALYAISTDISTTWAALLFLLCHDSLLTLPHDLLICQINRAMECLQDNGALNNNQPDTARDECVCLLLELGANKYDPSSVVMSRIIKDHVRYARLPQRINEAIVGMAHHMRWSHTT